MGIMTIAEKRSWAVDDDRWYSPLFPASVTGIDISSEGALRNTALWNGVNIICGTLTTFPLRPFIDTGNGADQARDHATYPILTRKPSPWHTPSQFKSMMELHLLIHGNAIAEIVENGRGEPVYLVPMIPNRVKMRVMNDGSIYYIRRARGGVPEKIFKSDEVIHIRGLSNDGLVGYNPILTTRESMAVSIAAEDYAARFYSQNTRPQGALQSPSKLDKQTKQNIAASWVAAYGGADNYHKVAILDEGLEFQSLGLDAEESQMLETRKFGVNEVARLLNMPLHMLKDLESGSSGYNSVVQHFMEFAVVTMTPITVAWQEELNIKLFTEAEQRSMYVKYSMEGLLRGDPETRGKFYQTLMGLGMLTPNEGLRLEDRNPVGPEGDQRFVSVQYLPLQEPRVAKEPERSLPDDELRELRSVGQRDNYRKSWERRFRIDAQKFTDIEVAGVSALAAEHLEKRDAVSWKEALREFYDSLREDIRQAMYPGFFAYSALIDEAAAAEISAQPTDTETLQRTVVEYTDAMVLRQTESHRRQLDTEVSEATDVTALEAVRTQLAEWDAGSAEDVAVREAVKLGAFVALSTWENKGVRRKKVVNPDPCPFCAKLVGMTVEISVPFISAGETITPDDPDLSSMTVRRTMKHPPFHSKCVCGVAPEV